MNSYDLGGHSGCRILLIEDDDGRVYVRKISKDVAYNNRLRIQSEKQAAFSKNKIAAPEVYNQGYTAEGLFYFDMQYIPGMTLAEYIKTMEIGKIRGLVESLVDSLVPKSEPDSVSDNAVVQIFAKKLADLRSMLKDHHNVVIDNALDLLDAHDWGKLTPTMCHGDMTLENIIIKNDRLYFIDFLDSFYESWFLDVGTLLQDVQVMWSYRFQKNTNMNTVLRLIVFRDLLLDSIRAINPDYESEIYYALLQKLIRIYPYTTDEHTYNFLNEKTSLVVEQIRKLDANTGGGLE